MLTLKVEVKHGLVKFEPLQMGLGKIVKKDFHRIGNKDHWTYITAFKSLDQLKKQSSGSLRLSVPIAGINNKIFKVWFAFGVKTIAKNDTAQKILADNTKTNSSVNSTNPGNEEASYSNQENQSHNSSTSPALTTTPTSNKTNGEALEQLKKYRINPKKKVFAETALIEYPILQTVLTFLLIDLIIIAGVFGYWRLSLKKRGKQK